MSKIICSEDILFQDTSKFKVIDLNDKVRIIGLTWNSYAPREFANLIKKNYSKDSTDIKIMPILDNKIQDKINYKKLEEEVLTFFKENKSIPQFLKENEGKDTETGKMLKISEETVNSLSGLIIPGGSDVNSIFYKKSNNVHQHSLIRDILEFSLLYNIDKKNEELENKIPVIGICRGAQLINVYYGGTLKNVENQCGVFQILKTLDTKNDLEMSKIINDYIISYSCHHQAINKLGENIKSIVEYNSNDDKIIKAASSEDNLKWLIQFHPESHSNIKQQSEVKMLELITITYSKITFNIFKNLNFKENIKYKEEDIDKEILTVTTNYLNKNFSHLTKDDVSKMTNFAFSYIKKVLFSDEYKVILKKVFASEFNHSELNIDNKYKELLKKYKEEIPTNPLVKKNKNLLIHFSEKCKRKFKLKELIKLPKSVAPAA